jgi:RNA polymerase sigma-70 factor (ECF subfamily)
MWGAEKPEDGLSYDDSRPGAKRQHEAVLDPGELIDQYRARIYKYLRYRGLGVEDANDLTSAVFERALKRLNGYNPERGAPSTWLFAIARNMLNSHWRASGLRKTLPLEAAEQQPGFDPPPEEVVVRGETRRELIGALASLDDRERDLIALKFSALMTNREIASLAGLTESNVGVILFRALRKLRALLSASTGGVR